MYLPQFVLYGVWSAWALGSVFYMEKDQPINLALINMALLLVCYSTSICGVFCGLPFFAYKIHERIENDINEVNMKIWKIKSLPQEKYDPEKFQEYTFCTICMDEFKEGSEVTYLPCDPRHYFDTQCITFWLCKQKICPLCKVEVNYDKSNMQSST